MSEQPLFPGQVERLEFSLEQLREIASPARSEVFWTYSALEPLSAQDVAERMNRAAGTIHYHTKALLEVGLLVLAESRRRGARTESLYVRAGRSVYGRNHPMTDEYRKAGSKGFHAIMRSLGRERAALHRVIPEDPSLAQFCIFQLLNYRLSAEDGQRLCAELMAVLSRYRELQDPKGVRVRIAVVTHPEMGEIRHAYKEATGMDLRAEPETEDPS